MKVFGFTALCLSHVAAHSVESFSNEPDTGVSLLQTKASSIKKHDPFHWGYDDLEAWTTNNPSCAGSAQSPIDIPKTVYDNTNQDTLDAAYLPIDASQLSIINNGHALKVGGAFGKLTLPDGIYNVKQLNFHCPSEHSIDGEKAECEMHIMHQREGSTGTNDLAMVSILFDTIKKAGATESSGLVLDFLRHLGFGKDLPKAGETRQLTGGLDLRKTFGEALEGGYYHYVGSMTTPPCTENVHWYVLRKKAAISLKMVEQFKRMFPDPSDARPVQALNGRQVVSDKDKVDGEFGEAVEHPHWTYNSPSQWLSKFPECAGRKQSPINLVGGQVDDFVSLLPKFDDTPVSGGLSIFNDGHTAQVNAKLGVLNLPDGKYNVGQVHFHMPSEHRVDGQAFIGEMQIVAQKEGATETNDLAIIAILLKEVKAKEQDEQTSKELAFFRQMHFGNLPTVDQEKPLKGGVDLAAAFEPHLGGKYWHYQGSMTTPPCSEGVHWYVMEKPAHVSKHMVHNFHELFPSPMNSRPVQDLNGRILMSGAIATGDKEFN